MELGLPVCGLWSQGDLRTVRMGLDNTREDAEMTTRIYRVTHGGDRQGTRTEHYMSYSAAVLSLIESGYGVQRDADPDNNTTGWATRNGFFGGEDAFIGWLDVHGRCPAYEVAELAKEAV